MGFRTESEAIEDRELFEVSFLRESLISLPLDGLQRGLGMSQIRGRGAQELGDVRERLTGGPHTFVKGFYTN